MIHASLLLPQIKKFGEVFVTDAEFNRLFDAPKTIDPIKALALSLSGNRPAETQDDILRIWCEQNGVEHRIDYETWNHHFRFTS